MLFLISKGCIGYMPPVEELENPKDKFASEIFSSDMKVLGNYYQSQGNRVYVDYQDISPNLVNALISTEDERFYQHSGIDFMAIGRAVFKRMLLMGKSAGGGSTITQQLAKQLFSPSVENKLERLFQKPIEWVIALQLERFYTKEEIIKMYLNKFDFLYNAVGVQSAAAVYFSTTPDKLTIEESAMLIGMCKNPSYFNPIRHPERTLGRRNTVLQQMYKADYITKQERDSLQQLPLNIKFSRADHKEGLAPYFREKLRIMLIAKKPHRSDYRGWQHQQYVDDSIAWATNPLYGWCDKTRKPDGSKYNIYTDGLKIYTTIDSRMQRYAEDAVEEHMLGVLQPQFFAELKNKKNAPFSSSVSQDEINRMLERAKKQSDRYRRMKQDGVGEEEITRAFNKRLDMQVYTLHGIVDTIMTPMDSIRYYKSFLHAGFMVTNSKNGHVKAYVGGVDFNQFQYDMVSVGRRQVGSTIKPFLYTLAMEEGFTPCDLAPNVQPHIVDPSTGNVWSPRNASNKRVGEMVTLRWGLATSNNWISAWLMSQLSPSALARLMHSFGIRNYIDPVMALCLGPAEVSVEEMVTAYTAFSNKGIRVDPIYVTRIEDNFGNIISTFTPRMTEVVSERAYYRILSLLQDVVNYGTGARIRFRYNITAPMGGKTGTTNNNSDGWFMAFTPQLAAGVWVGGEDRSIHFDRMAMGQGASMALPIYGLFIQKVYSDPTLGYTQTENFTVPTEYANPCQADVGGVVRQQQQGRTSVQPDEIVEGIFD
ncbi:MAG: transglycosylase domain-containing protein [Bacteroidales bacterium]